MEDMKRISICLELESLKKNNKTMKLIFLTIIQKTIFQQKLNLCQHTEKNSLLYLEKLGPG